MSQVNLIIADSHNILKLDTLELRDPLTDTKSYVNDATVTGRVQDTAGSDVSGETWPITLTYVSGSNGKYMGTFANTAALTVGTQYLVKVVATTTGGVVRTFVEDAVAVGSDV